MDQKWTWNHKAVSWFKCRQGNAKPTSFMAIFRWKIDDGCVAYLERNKDVVKISIVMVYVTEIRCYSRPFSTALCSYVPRNFDTRNHWERASLKITRKPAQESTTILFIYCTVFPLDYNSVAQQENPIFYTELHWIF